MAPRSEFNVDTQDQLIQRLLVRTEGLERHFELAYDEERVVTVGTAASVDFQLESANVSPIHFYFERIGCDIWIVPAYGVSDLRVNAAKITTRRSLGFKSIIEFGNVQIMAEVPRLQHSPTTVSCPTRQPRGTVDLRNELRSSFATTSLARPCASAKAELRLTRRVGHLATNLPGTEQLAVRGITDQVSFKKTLLGVAPAVVNIKNPARRKLDLLTWLGRLAKRYPIRACMAAIALALAGSGAVVFSTKVFLLTRRGSLVRNPRSGAQSMTTAQPVDNF